MKPKFYIGMLFMPMFFCCQLFAQSHYYWYNKKKIQLKEDSSIFYISLKDASAVTLFQQEFVSIKDIKSSSELYSYPNNGLMIETKNPAVVRKLIEKQSSVEYLANELSLNGKKMIILPRIVLELKDGHHINDVLALERNTLSIKQDLGYNTYVLNVKVKSNKEVLRLSNRIYEQSGLANWCEPDFYGDIEPTNDPLYPQQYYLNNTGQFGGTPGIDIDAPQAWTFTTGTAIRVAIVDQGLEAHEEFTGRILPGFTAGSSTGTGLPQNGKKYHGMNCAGIIGASNNNSIGIRGIAPNVRLLSVNIFPNASGTGAATMAEIVEAIDKARVQGAVDIFNNSWAGGPYSSAFDAAVNRAVTLGRGGKGCPFIFAAGNAGIVEWPATLNDVQAVGAIQNTGAIWGYSGKGPTLDMVAPSGDHSGNGDVYTTDRMGDSGYTTGNYRINFGGASASCPQVTGIAALVLRINPNLSAYQVYEIIRSSCIDMGPAGRDDTYGYGRVNACRAVDLAVLSLGITGNPVCNTNPITYSVNNLPSALHVISWSVSPAGIINITPNGNSVTIKKVTNGVVTLKANLGNGCSGPLTIERVFEVSEFPSTPVLSTQQGGNTFTITSTYSGLPRGFDWYVDGVRVRTNADHIMYRDVACGQTIRVKCQQTTPCGISPFSQEIPVTNFCLVPSSQFSVFPNPSTSIVTIQAKNDKVSTKIPRTISAVRVFDNMGKLRKEVKLPNGNRQVQINVSEFPAGVYILEITDGKNIERQKLVISGR